MNRLVPGTSDDPTGTVIVPESYEGFRICAPGNIRVRRNSSTTAILTWDEPYSLCNLCPDAIGYEVFGERFSRQSVTRPPCEIRGLSPSVEYLFHVTAIAAGNNVSDPGVYRLLKMAPPGRPAVPKVSALTYANVTLTWAPSIQQDRDLRYHVYLNGILKTKTKEPSVTLAHLQSYTQYLVEVRAVNAAGDSEPSATTFKTKVRPPTNLRFRYQNGLCRLLWDPVFRHRPIYEVSINGKSFKTVPGIWGYNFQLADVSPGPVPHHLKFSVRAQLDGDFSEAVLLEKTVVDGVPPSQPGALVVSGITDTGAVLAWEPSSDDIAVAGYHVLLNGFIRFPAPNAFFTFTQLTSGAYHWVMVRSHDKQGNVSKYSQAAVFKTNGQAPQPAPDSPGVKITPLTSTTAKLEFSPGVVAGVGHRVVVNNEHRVDTIMFPVTLNLQVNVEHTISVSAFDLFGQLSEPTVLIYVPKDIIAPSMPENLLVAAMSPYSVTLAWEASTDDIGIHGYVIYNDHEYFDSTSLTSYSAFDLLPGNYSFEVCALDFSGNASEPAAITIDIGDPPNSISTNFR
ncbi:fibronectin type III domain-containing protein [Pseudomonas mandelii]|uniref:fibronectin type III domain-containing protein n=1 Tax=Pseudomonas mandelii TaxID=75612 RepID=UPI00224B46F0|nr:fibronectin type III domain-containing protein [Pseudomonas mandelii]MCX2899602.1 fibronectin type III domain-containing protein [Pseudomonas mandelii]